MGGNDGMTEKLMYKCDHCRKVMATVAGMERHEKQCLHNPDGHNCYSCDKSFLGDYDDDCSYSVAHDVPICAYTQDIIRENFADRCCGYKRTDKSYHNRTEKDAEAAVDAELNGQEVQNAL